MSGKAGSFGRALGAQEVLEGLLFCVPQANQDLSCYMSLLPESPRHASLSGSAIAMLNFPCF